MGIDGIDLLKISIEGVEYQLLSRVLDEGLAERIGNFQIQFHSFVKNAEAMRDRIGERLGKTHTRNWCYVFVWENWKLGRVGSQSRSSS